ncbi:hypothetical protein T484DRAFT_1824556 [Baffinella frigidus]|nr:hypothetical protein T484DRAFT_1824556 [Cryptophyta sp. CCMP2293]
MHRDAYADRPAPTGRKMLAVAALAAAAVAPCGASPTAAFQLPTGLTSARLQFAGSATSALAPSRRPAPRVALGGLHAKAESRGPLDHLRGAVVAGAFLLGVLGGGGVPDVHAQGPPTPNGARPAVSVDVQVQGDGAESPSDLKIRDATGKFFEILKDLDSSYDIDFASVSPLP